MNKTKKRNRSNDLQALVSLFSIVVSVILAVTKTVVAFFSGSMSILSSAIDSVFDVVNSIINFGAVKYSAKPADKEHKFGHYAIEDITGLFQSALIMVSASVVILKSIDNIVKNAPIKADDLGIGVMILSLVLTLVLVAFQQIVIKKAPSLTIESLALHYTGDILTNSAIIGGLFYGKYYNHTAYIDSSLAIIISIYLIIKALGITKRSYDNLMDKEIDGEFKKRIHAILRDYRGVIDGYHDVKTRKAGSRIFVQLHLEIDRETKLQESHDIADRIKERILKLADNIEVIIHQDPV